MKKRKIQKLLWGSTPLKGLNIIWVVYVLFMHYYVNFTDSEIM